MHTQLTLPAFGPDGGDRFRFTWWNAREGTECWVEYRGWWRASVIAGRGRKYVTVEIAGAGGRRSHVRKLYSELRRVR